jgi:hypothetical protein
LFWWPAGLNTQEEDMNNRPGVQAKGQQQGEDAPTDSPVGMNLHGREVVDLDVFVPVQTAGDEHFAVQQAFFVVIIIIKDHKDSV